MEPTQQFILGLAPIFVILALILILAQTLHRRKREGMSVRPTPVAASLALYAVGVGGLLFITYAPHSGIAGHPALRIAVLVFFTVATAMLVLSILLKRPDARRRS